MSDNYVIKEYIWTAGSDCPGSQMYIFTKGKSYFTNKDGFVITDKGDEVDPKSYPKMIPAHQVYHVDEFGMKWAGTSPRYGFKVFGDNVTENDKEVADRHNDGKPEMSYVLQGPKGLEGLARVLEFGSRKYDRGNWLKGFPDTSLIDSMMRHLAAYISGEVLDPESGLPHIDHIHANAKFLAEHGERDAK